MPEIRKSCLTRDLQRLQILEFILTVMVLQNAMRLPDCQRFGLAY